jgi:hypothetical protein
VVGAGAVLLAFGGGKLYRGHPPIIGCT